MGGHEGPFFGRWRWLDGLRAWCDAHDLVVIAAAALGSVLLVLAFMGTVAATTFWLKIESIESRLGRIERAVFVPAKTGRSSPQDEEDLGNATAGAE